MFMVFLIDPYLLWIGMIKLEKASCVKIGLKTSLYLLGKGNARITK